MTRHTALLAAMLLASAAPPAFSADPAIEAIEISSARDPDFKPYVRMLAGLDAFERLQAMAPGAALRFLLRPKQPGLTTDGVRLRIAGDAGSHEVLLDGSGYFTLPRVLDAVGEHADMVTNRKKGLYGWRVDVRSPGVPEGMRRLGDLRVECEVRWAVTQDELNIASRMMFKAMGGPCGSARVNVINLAPQPVANVTLITQERRATLPANPNAKDPGKVYVVPLHDKSWPDDTLIAFDAPPQ
jgi:hypothetical protein